MGVSSNPLAAFDRLYNRAPRRWLVALLVGYLVAGGSFAYFTPPWQAPDEPAHYNYIAHIAITGTLPVLQMGDYNQEKLAKLLDSNFLRRLPPTVLRYENYQPPLYYLLLTPIYWLSGGSLLALRLFGVMLGAVTIVFLYISLTLVFPGKTLIPLGAAAFSALLPMHMAMAAAVNNDGLAELLLMASMLTLLLWMRQRFYGKPAQRRHLLLLGVLLGLGMLTKIYAYLMLPLVVAAVVVVTWLTPRVQSSLRDPVP